MDKGEKMKQYTYTKNGMDFLCQPMDFIKWEYKEGYKYEILTYERELTKEELTKYNLIKYKGKK